MLDATGIIHQEMGLHGGHHSFYRLVGDTNYGSAAMLGWLVDEMQIEPHMAVFDKSGHDDGTFSRSDFHWDEEANEYRCPAGNALCSNGRPFKNPRTQITKADTILYRSSQFDCGACETKADCCPTTPIRKLTRSIHEPARDVARAIAKTDAYKQSHKDRKKQARAGPHEAPRDIQVSLAHSGLGAIDVPSHPLRDASAALRPSARASLGFLDSVLRTFPVSSVDCGASGEVTSSSAF